MDCAVVIEPTAGDVNVVHLQERGLPVVSLGRQTGNDAVPDVDIHSSATTELLLNHLRVQSSKHMALLAGAQRNSYVEAPATYERFLDEHGMTPLVAPADESRGEDARREACASMLAPHPEVDGLCARVDAFALGAVRAIAKTGKCMPHDIGVVTRYDGARAQLSAAAHRLSISI